MRLSLALALLLGSKVVTSLTRQTISTVSIQCPCVKPANYD